MVGDKDYMLNKDRGFLKLEISPEYSEIVRLLHDLRNFFRNHNFTINHANEICLVVEELVVNAIMHGYKNIPLTEREKICIEVSCDDGKVSILLRDAGVPFDPTLPGLPRKENSVGGWGLMLVKKMMHDFRYERDGKYNVLKLFKQYRRK